MDGTLHACPQHMASLDVRVPSCSHPVASTAVFKTCHDVMFIVRSLWYSKYVAVINTYRGHAFACPTEEDMEAQITRILSKICCT